MMTDFRALCAELHTAFNTYAVDESHHDLLVCVDAALAQPEPEPEVDDILRLAAIIREVNGGKKLGAAALAEAILSHRDSCWGRSAQSEPQGSELTDEELIDLFNENNWNYISPETFIDIARSVLDYWGCPAVEPVLVSERLPKRKDCDAEGKCWWAANDGIYDHWRKLDLDKALNNPWRPTHWLPHHALPVPQQEAGQ